MISRRSLILALAVALSAAGPGGPARADHAPTLVVPGRTPAPIIVNGEDVGWTVIEGDWGLYRPGHVSPVVYGYPAPIYVPAAGGCYPVTGRPPRYGRLEGRMRGTRRGSAPAEPYFRSWSADSLAAPAHYYPTFDPPRIIKAPAFK